MSISLAVLLVSMVEVAPAPAPRMVMVAQSVEEPGLVFTRVVAASAPHVRSGKLRALAVSTRERIATLPDVPTAEEAGLPGYVVTTWYGVFAPAGSPSAIVNRLHTELVKAMQTAEVRSKLEGIGADGSVSKSPAEFAALVRADTARYAKIVKDIGLRIE